ncbi:KleE stable inheritance protein [Nitrosovibrio sp. Nv6]|uniref:KleE stable inheritance protein n=1 Tax=Nitrosovibrio sp. Nv6 TaxID=1855340 RepID=UPI0008C3CE78|nr:KleE stable inheritance protein [Nitrosovibrio sp. Nv6]SEP42739.1 hypothetical protein SAMN05216316_3033 [Nitrosovibrio sp. Nv6]
MAKIIMFPSANNRSVAGTPPVAVNLVLRFVNFFVATVWVITVLSWPTLRWIGAFTVTLQGFRMLMLFSDKGVFLDWIFIGYFSGYVALHYFVATYRPAKFSR